MLTTLLRLFAFRINRLVYSLVIHSGAQISEKDGMHEIKLPVG